jgi:putative nucleotidyltransferase with HDIG domain
MSETRENDKSRVFQMTVTVAGLLLWGVGVAEIAMRRTTAEQLTLLALMPLAIIVGMFPITFPLPSGLKFTSEKVSFTLSDAFILLVACRYGMLPAVALAGLEGFVSSRATVRRLSSNLFSSGMMSLAASAAAACLTATLTYAFGNSGSFTAASCALLVASLIHLAVNVGLLSTLLALRHGDPVLSVWRKNFLFAASMFLPTSTAASLMYLALQSGFVVVLIIGAPVLVTIYFVHRQYRDGVRSRIEALAGAHRQTVEALAVAINAKDEVTHEHVTRVQTYAAGVARLLGCNEGEVEALKAGALLHDIGKIAVPDYILNKPGKLTAEEFNQMKLHTVVGAQILSRVEFPFPVVPVVRHHHERWDGRGYPDGLKGEEIPLTARVLSVVDCFDAVREDRQYRKAMTREQAINFILEGIGTMYDPQVVGTFLAHLPEFEAEIAAMRGTHAPTFGIEPTEKLSDNALGVLPAAGLAAESNNVSGDDTAATDAAGEQALQTLASALASCKTDDEKAVAFVQRLAAVVPFDTCALVRVVEETGECRIVRAAGRNAALLEGRPVAHTAGVTNWAIINCKPFFNSDPKLDLPEDIVASFADYRTLAVAPIAHDHALFGAISLYSAALTEYDARRQQLLCEAASLFARSLTTGVEEPRVETASQAKPQSFAVTTLESSLTH